MLNSLDPGKRLLVYLVINIIVSAATTLTVLVIWSSLTFSGPNIGGDPTATQANSSSGQVSISAIIGADDLANEHVVIENTGSQDLSLAGWLLRDQNGNEYHFPALVLHPGAEVNVFTRQGEDSASDLYWGRSVTVWISGELAELFDPSETLQASYTAP